MVMLTATPHSGDEAAFTRLTSTGSLDASPLLVFRRTRVETSRQPRHTHWLRVRLTPAELQLDQALMAYARRVWARPASPGARLAMIIVTRRACSSALSLARTLERRLALLAPDECAVSQLSLPLDAAESEDQEPDVQVGAPGLEDAVDERKTLENLLALAREASGASSKLRALTRLLRRSGEPAIVFTEYRDTLLALERSLAGFTTCQLHGGLSAAERTAVIRGFACGKWRVLLATDAASEGLNLQQRCRLVVHLEVPWTPTRIEQRVGRVDRIGQSRTVHQVHLVATGTVEETRVTGIVQRLSRVASTLNGLAASRSDEQQIAGCVIGDEELPATTTTPLPQAVITLELREHSAREAARIMIARQLRPRIGSEDAALLHIRPFVSTARRIRSPGVLWAVWLECTDSEGQVVFETLVGVHAAHRWTKSVSATEFRTRIDECWRHVQQRVVSDAPRISAFSETLRTTATVALERERAIARAIEERQARLAATLVQGALFERRVEREAVAQRALVEQALTRSRIRIDELQRRQTLVVASRPAFSLITW